MDAVYASTCNRCGGNHPTASSIATIDLSSLLKKAIEKVYQGNATKVKEQLSQAYGATFSEAITEGMAKKTIMSVAWESPDWEMIKHLQKNVYEFSFAKSHEQLKAVTAALYDSDGKIIPFKEFKEIAGRINNEFSTAHLKAEYNTALAGGQMSSRWVQYQDEKDVFPNLTYQTVGDERVRQSHSLLDNVTKNIDDAFWKTYYPPNGWNCRCDVIQAVGRKETSDTKIVMPDDVPVMFKTNLAENGLVFPKGHPFFEKLPSEITEAANNSNPFVYTKIHKGKKGGYVYDNEMRASLDAEIKTANALADTGEKVILLPELHSDTQWQKKLRELCLPESIAKKKINPDARVNGEIMEFKNSIGSYGSFNRALRTGQSENICITLGKAVEQKQIKEWIKARFNAGTKLNQIWIIDIDNKIFKYLASELK